ncbi:protein abnormal spindle [Teleopsis dalmanni]|uniref:protein abnormal spindle n=1 Tax=Teleopsis dalmanni TaxID=139649 RepID=UPI0018CFCDA3|nr:protein abnormal spindle [Teleopsis dalmanni]
MSAFEVKVTPTRNKNKKPPEGKEPTNVIMAPFSAKSIVQFEDVPVTKTAKRILKIINTADEDIEVKVTKMVNPAHGISIDWNENVVPAQSELIMEMIWNPTLEVACTETLQLTDNRNFRKDIMIILKTKTALKTTRKFPTVSSNRTSYTKTLRLKSPTGINKQKKSLTASSQQQKRSTSTREVLRPKWLNTIPQSSVQAQRIKSTKNNTSPLIEHNNYIKDVCVNNISPVIVGSDTYKENISPLTPGNVMNLIDDIKFTPIITQTLSNSNIKSYNLALLPTPVNRGSSENIECSNIRPRRLSTDLVDDDEVFKIKIPDIKIDLLPTEEKQPSVSLINNKTFNVKHRENSAYGESVELTQEEMQFNTLVTLNKTTTISSSPMGRPLDMITEEATPVSSINDLQKPSTNTIQNTEKLKRDIKLVGAPLRKHSESMTDLLKKKPQAKFGTQGSLPNLNEMETIRSIEQNRYFYQNAQYNNNGMSVIYEHNTVSVGVLDESESPLESSTPNCSQISLVSNGDLLFNQNEILAQSSRFNINEVGLRSNKKIMTYSKAKKPLNIKTSIKNNVKPHKNEEPLNENKRKSNELSFSDSPTESNTSLSIIKSSYAVISPPKRMRVDSSPFQRPSTTYTSITSRHKNWSQAPERKMRLSTTLSLVKKPITPRKIKEKPIVKLYDTELYLQQCINPDPFAASTTTDPFLASTMYLDEYAIEKHLQDFKKWLNALVSLPADLNVDRDTKIDVGKLFSEVRNKELIIAPTKEEQSANYLTKFRLESLRNAAVKLYFSNEMRVPCSNVAVHINKNDIRIRSDRNLHLDVVMQRYILELLLCFNPLWLRLGLEVVFGETIHLHSNSDIVGLSTFILNRLFRDKYKEQQFSKAYSLSDEYADYIKKHTLRKMLFLLLFLDKAKTKRIIKHNPCLFVKKSPHKETKEILLRFASELLANIGDITRDLKRHGYVLQHKQSYLDEFDYAFNNIAIDLRDGVRLTRVMEIILLRDDMTKQLRVPAISRLQRVFNVNLALRALNEAKFELKGDISATDIVDGHREKTLSLLWQIIYKFRSPKFHGAASVLQKWWRNIWLRVNIQRRIQHKIKLKREVAATKIQSFFRGHISRKYVRIYKDERVKAATLIQKHIRGILSRKHIFKMVCSAIYIQRWYRANIEGLTCRRRYQALRTSTIIIQRRYRQRLVAKKLLEFAKAEKLRYLEERELAAQHIQSYWRAYRIGANIRKTFLLQRKSAIIVQRKFRAIKANRIQRSSYLQLRDAALTVQRRYRAKKLMLLHRKRYLLLQKSACIVQERYRARMLMMRERKQFLLMKQSALVIQRKLRATFLKRRVCAHYISLQYYTTVLQQKFRCKKLMLKQRAEYQELRLATIFVQRKFRANHKMRLQRAAYVEKLQAVRTIQQRFRAYKNMRYWRAKYRGVREATICIQQYVRSYQQTKRERDFFLKQKRGAVLFQKHYRSLQNMRKVRNDFLQLKTITLNMQRRYRAKLMMRKEKQIYDHKRALIVYIQQRYRAKLLGRKTREEYQRTRNSLVNLQRHVRATLLMRQLRTQYLEKRGKIILIQRYYRNYQTMNKVRTSYRLQRAAVIKIQTWYRSILLMQTQRSVYLRTRSNIIMIQQKWHATIKARLVRQEYLETLQKVTLLQRKIRATLAMSKARQAYQKQRTAAITLQNRYRARLIMLKMRSQYLLIRTLVIYIQQKYRGYLITRHTRSEYLKLKEVTIHLQQKFRGQKLMQEERIRFVNLRKSTLEFQANARGFLARTRFQALLTPEMIELMRQKKAVKIIQKYWRGYNIRKRFHNVRILAIRRNIKLLKDASKTFQSIRWKVQDSVRVLSSRFCVSESLHVLSRLDRISRTVPHLLMSQSDFISNFCYGTMAQAIRSEVDKQIIEYSSRIILNLARYNSTTANTFQEGGLVTIAQMLLRWCDKDCEIFNTLCTLIWIFSHCPRKREIIYKFMTSANSVFLLRETRKLVARKEKMKQNIRKTNNPRCPQNKIFSSRALPSLEPDYGVICNKPYIFISSVYAFETVLYKLGINII